MCVLKKAELCPAAVFLGICTLCHQLLPDHPNTWMKAELVGVHGHGTSITAADSADLVHLTHVPLMPDVQ